MRTLIKLQTKLITQGILVRGAISFGELFSDDTHNIVVGPGLINAYRLEAKAIYPRIIIDRKIIPLLYENSIAMIKDSDGRILIKPPAPYRPDFPYLNYTYKLALIRQVRKLENVIDLLRTNSYLNDNIDKYLWLIEHISLSVQRLIDYIENKPSRSRVEKNRLSVLTRFKSKIELI